MEWVVLVLQLFIQGGEQVRAEIPVSSLEECFELAKEAMTIREHKGGPIIGVAAGCHLTITDQPT